MKKTLGGSTFIWNGIKQDYNFIETLECLYALCDEVSVVFGGDDGTDQKVMDWVWSKKQTSDKMIHIHWITKEEWDAQQGRTKLSYFSNIAIEKLFTDWNFYLQSDEILHEESFPFVRMAIEMEAEAFMCRRLNLWKDADHMLNVPQDRKPCSTEVIRLAKTKYRCVDDAESLGVPSVNVLEDIDLIQIYHMGFIRDEVKHLEKIKNMQVNVFLWGDYDVKAKNCDKFEPERWFSDSDLIKIPRPLPRFIQAWADERYKKSPE